MIRSPQPTTHLHLERLNPRLFDWKELDRFPDHEVFQTREWLEFICRTQAAEPVLAAVKRDSETVGYFTGGVIRRLGVRMLGSPFPGWTTGALGFNLRAGIDRGDALAALPWFAWRELGCVHAEIKDRRITAADYEAHRFRHSAFFTFEIDLTPTEDELFAAMSSSCRRAIRKSAKEGVSVEEAEGEDFADEYYAQLVDVFAKQDLKPPYDVERVRELIRCVHPGGDLLLLRALSSEGERIATGIFPARNQTAWFWGGASWRSHQVLRPNEALFWHAMRHWKDRGISVLDTGGGGDYKRKYGVREVTVPMGRRARVPGLVRARDLAASIYGRAAFGGRA